MCRKFSWAPSTFVRGQQKEEEGRGSSGAVVYFDNDLSSSWGALELGDPFRIVSDWGEWAKPLCHYVDHLLATGGLLWVGLFLGEVSPFSQGQFLEKDSIVGWGWLAVLAAGGWVLRTEGENLVVQHSIHWSYPLHFLHNKHLISSKKNSSYLGIEPLGFWLASFPWEMYKRNFNGSNYSS